MPARVKYQVMSYLFEDERKVFCEIAKRNWLSKSALALILIRRELAIDRLGDLKVKFDHNAPALPANRVLARFWTAADERRFAGHAASHDLKPNQAAGIIFRAEVNDFWLDRATFLDSS